MSSYVGTYNGKPITVDEPAPCPVGRGDRRDFVIREGGTYIVQPIPHGNSYNRGRACTVTGLLIDQKSGKQLLCVRFLDNSKIGTAGINNLVPMTAPTE